jgi:uncharacterized membrane protein
MSDDEHSSNPPARTERAATVHVNGKQTAKYSAEFSGPLPPPSLLYEYERACLGAADRIIRMAEQEAEHRRLTETAIVRAGTEDLERGSADSKRGQIFALVIVMASIGGCVYLAINGHEWAAGALGLGPLSTVVGSFILGRRGQNSSAAGEKSA